MSFIALLSVKGFKHQCHTREESGRNSTNTLDKATIVLRKKCWTQPCAFNTDSKEAAAAPYFFLIYAEDCGYYYHISMWIFTKILYDHRHSIILTA